MKNVELLLIKWLNNQEDLPEAFLNIPADRPSSFLTVERTGGREHILGLPLIAIQVWGTTRVDAGDMAMQVAGTIQKLAFEPWIGRVNVTSVYNFPDPDSKQARYQITLDLVTQLNI